MTTTSRLQPTEIPCPYRGLSPFREADAHLFFGRHTFVERLVTAVQAQSLVAVVGSSGSGKSSVVFAGLLPRLRREKNWLIAEFRPGKQPFQALAAALLPLLEPQLPETERLVGTNKLAELLQRKDVSLPQIVKRILDKHQECDRLLLVADQFEELYALSADDLATRHRFLDQLLAHGDTSRPTGCLVLTLHADFMGEVLSYRPFADRLQDNTELLGPMNHDELHDAITLPLIGSGVTCEAGLVARIVEDAGQHPGNLPLLEFSLTTLWEQRENGRLTHAAYEKIGKVKGALSQYADATYQQLTAAEKEQAHRLFLQLVQSGEGRKDVPRQVTGIELESIAPGLVSKMAEAQLLVTGQNEIGQETVEITHEALIQNWKQLQEWLQNENRAFRTEQERSRLVPPQRPMAEQDEVSSSAPSKAKKREGATSQQPGLRKALLNADAQRSQRGRKRMSKRFRQGALITGTLLLVIALGVGVFLLRPWWLTRCLPDCPNRNLSSLDLSEATLSGGNLSQANLNDSDLSNANLSSANLNSADLRFARLNSADLHGTDLRGAVLRSAVLINTDLSEADLSDADLSDANLRGAVLHSADLHNANLRSAVLVSTDLNSADLGSAVLFNADLSGANLSSANLSNAVLSSVNLDSAVLSSARLDDADLRSTDLRNADLNGADLRNANVSDANLSNANLSGANLNSADLSFADLNFADLRGTDLRGANLSGANLNSTFLNGARYNIFTQWPAGFDPMEAGATLEE